MHTNIYIYIHTYIHRNMRAPTQTPHPHPHPHTCIHMYTYTDKQAFIPQREGGRKRGREENRKGRGRGLEGFGRNPRGDEGRKFFFGIISKKEKGNIFTYFGRRESERERKDWGKGGQGERERETGGRGRDLGFVWIMSKAVVENIFY